MTGNIQMTDSHANKFLDTLIKIIEQRENCKIEYSITTKKETKK